MDDRTLALLGDRAAQERITKRGELLPCPMCGCAPTIKVQEVEYGLSRDFDLLDSEDWYGITYDGQYGGVYMPSDRLVDIMHAHQQGIKTWVSFEPVVNADRVLECIENCDYIFDKVKIGKLNYWPSDINWAEFGKKAEGLCRSLGLEYYIKESLRKEMEANHDK